MPNMGILPYVPFRNWIPDRHLAPVGRRLVGDDEVEVVQLTRHLVRSDVMCVPVVYGEIANTAFIALPGKIG